MDSGLVGAVIGLENERDRRFETPRTLGMYLAELQSLPGLVGLWNMGSVQRSTGNVYDLSGQGHSLTYNGNPAFTQLTTPSIPYIQLDGTGDYLSRADETDLDILGTETIYNVSVRGLTLLAWFNPAATSGGSNLVVSGKLLATTQLSYWLAHNTADGLAFRASGDGTTIPVDANSAAMTIGAWHCGVGRYIPSTSGVVWLDGVPTTDATDIPASLFSGSAGFQIGATGTPGNYFNGGVAIAALYANALPTTKIDQLWRWGRGLFGV